MTRRLLAPRMLGLHLVAIIATAAAVLLGVWQYGAWQNGREDQAAARVGAAPVPLDSALSADQAFPGDAVGRPVAFSGRWVSPSTLYVANRELRGRRGVWVVTPVEVCAPTVRPTRCAGAPAVLVVRGWAPSVQGAPPPPSGRVRVTGWLQPGEGSGVTDPRPGDNVIPELRIADALQRVDQDLYGGYVIAERVVPGSASGALQALTPAALPKATAFTALRNLLYALEWWVFGGFAVFMWWRWCRDEVTRVTQVPSSA